MNTKLLQEVLYNLKKKIHNKFLHSSLQGCLDKWNAQIRYEYYIK